MTDDGTTVDTHSLGKFFGAKFSASKEKLTASLGKTVKYTPPESKISKITIYGLSKKPANVLTSDNNPLDNYFSWNEENHVATLVIPSMSSVSDKIRINKNWEIQFPSTPGKKGGGKSAKVKKA